MNAERDPLEPGELSSEAVAETAGELAAETAAETAAAPVMSSQARYVVPALTEPPAAAASAPVRRSRAIVKRLMPLLSFVFFVALFAVGIVGGVTAFNRLQPPPPVIGDVLTAGVETPGIVVELVNALRTNDSDSLHSAVSNDPYRLLAGEMQSWDLKTVSSVETLATLADGTASATEIVIVGRTSKDAPIVFNMVVQVDNGVITEFR